MPVRRNTDAYGGRFAVDPAGSSILAGYQQATNKLDRDLIKRNIKPYKEYGFEQSLNDLQDMTDQQRYAMATKAVLAKHKVGGKPARSGGKSKPKKPSTKPRRTPVKPKAPAKPVKPKAPPKRKPAPKPKPKQPQHLPPKGAARPVQRKPPKGAAQPKPHLPPKPAMKPPVKRKPVVPPASGRAPLRV